MTRTPRKILSLTAVASLALLTACGNSVAEPPALSDIDELLWETTLQQESVTITANSEDFTGMAEDDVAIFGDFVDGDDLTLNIYGDLGGSATALGLDDNDLIRVFDQQDAYVSADALFSILGTEGLEMGGAEEEMFASMAEEFEGDWVDFSSELEADDEEFNIGVLLQQLEENWHGTDNDAETPIARDEISDEGTHEVRNDQDVWIYTGSEEGQELVLEADPDAPRILAIIDGQQSIRFSDWNETEAPQRPDQAQVISQEELEMRMMEAILGGGPQ